MTEPFPNLKLDLTQIERQADVVQKIRKHYEDRLARLRSKNDNDLDDKETARLRGAISEIKTLLSALAATPTPPVADDKT